MTPLERFRERLTHRLVKLDALVDVEHPVGPEWSAYVETGLALAKLTHETTSTTPLLTTKQMAERMNVHPKTILRRRKQGLLTPVSSPKAGRKGAALRWPAS
jgi:hypothetical protein